MKKQTWLAECDACKKQFITTESPTCFNCLNPTSSAKDEEIMDWLTEGSTMGTHKSIAVKLEKLRFLYYKYLETKK